MNILILGSGGREHAFAWKIAQSPKVEKLFVAPGNAGTASVAQNVDIKADDFQKIADFSLENQVDMIVVGSEDPLVKGVADFFRSQSKYSKIAVIGPSKKGAQLEGSKEFAKEFMAKYGVPTGAYQSFSKENIQEGYHFLEMMKQPYVLKADGLAAGKGVLIINNLEEAKAELKAMLVDAKFGKASSKVVIEEYLNGIELSVFVLVDESGGYKILPEAKDYKRVGEGDTGLNTGGMGSVSPVKFAQGDFMKKVEERIIKPTVNGLVKEKLDYNGFVFIGLMNVAGNPYVIEYNVRMGDPETEVVLPRIKTDFVDLLEGVAQNRLNKVKYQVDQRVAVTVIAVSGGYPGEYEKNKVITGLNEIEDSILFHAGTTNKENQTVTDGGRVIAVTSLGSQMEEALEKSYKNISKIKFEGINYRKDIGFDLK